MEGMLVIFKEILGDVDGGMDAREAVFKHIDNPMFGEGIKNFWEGVEDVEKEDGLTLRTALLLNVGLVIEVLERKLDPSMPGPTGEFPDGEIDKDDRGEIKISIEVNERGNIRLSFGTTLEWLEMGAQDALNFSQAIANQAKGIIKQWS